MIFVEERAATLEAVAAEAAAAEAVLVGLREAALLFSSVRELTIETVLGSLAINAVELRSCARVEVRSAVAAV